MIITCYLSQNVSLLCKEFSEAAAKMKANLYFLSVLRSE